MGVVSSQAKAEKQKEEIGPCSEPFPEGLGPLSVRQTSFRATDIDVVDFDAIAGGRVRFARCLFNRSKALETLAFQLDATRSWTDDNLDTLELRISPSHAVNLPEDMCALLGIPAPSEQEVQFAWVYPASFEHGCSESSDSIVSPLVENLADELDMDNPDVSFLTIGGYVYFNILHRVPDFANSCGFQELKWMFADSQHMIFGKDFARRDLLGSRWKGPLLPDALAENIHNYILMNPQKDGRPIIIRAANTNAQWEKEFSTPEEAIHWLRMDGSLSMDRTEDIANVLIGDEVESCADFIDWNLHKGCKGRIIDIAKRDDNQDVFLMQYEGGTCWMNRSDFALDKNSRLRQACRSSRQLLKLELLSAHAIRFSPNGVLQFSNPQAWSKTWTSRLVEQGRFRPITARKWVEAGARYLCWVRPDEVLPDERGKDRPLAHHGGFAFLFHDLEEDDDRGLDRFFEVVPSPALETARPLDDRIKLSCSCKSLPFSLNAMPLGHKEKVTDKLFTLARAGLWKLVWHLLAEYRFLACAHASDGGNTLLHVCAEKDLGDEELLQFLKERGAAYDATNAAGLRAEDLGSKSFKLLLRSIWALGPDLFEDPAAWFGSLDKNCSGLLDIVELSEGLAAEYRCDEVGARWLKSLVNVNCNQGVVSQVDFCGVGGLFDQLQCSEDFVGRRQKRTPALFRASLPRISGEEEETLIALAEQLNQMRLKHGWQPGKTAPASALPLPLPAPSPEGSGNAKARMSSARAMLGFTFEQTRYASAKTWQRGFRIDFAGQEGLDDGGLTKAWVNEIAYALWGDDALFDIESSGSMFKPDTVEFLMLDGVPVESHDLYHWTGRFVAYVLYQRCLMDCRLCPWIFRSLSRSAAPRDFHRSRSAVADVDPWPDSPEGEDRMLRDLACLDHVTANSFWRVAHEMTEDELRWLSFTCKDMELVVDGSEREITLETRAEYVKLSCETMLFRRCESAMQAFNSGFLEVLPDRFLNNVPEDGALRLLLGKEEISDDQMREFQNIVIPGGLVPKALADDPTMRRAAAWVFQVAFEGDGVFRTRFLEFWIGTGRVPLAGFASILPKPRLQVMVQAQRVGVKRIASWPKSRLPEGHTCGNELWIALPDSYEDFARQLRLAVQNFEAGFALR